VRITVRVPDGIEAQCWLHLADRVEDGLRQASYWSIKRIPLLKSIQGAPVSVRKVGLNLQRQASNITATE
jgi:hypothetical protein